MIRSILFAVLVVSFMVAIYAQAQVTEKQRVAQAVKQITSLLNVGQNDTTELTDWVDVDSTVGDVNTYFGQLQDSYGTLKGTFIFTAEVPQVDSYMGEVGVFKEGQILWTSGPIIDESSGKIFATMDLTNSGKVDIITTWLAGATGAYSDMWIFSWDGKKGVPINPYHRFTSEIAANRSGFLIQDINGNGKYVITCQLDTADVEYSWNGTSFQTITNPPVLSNNAFSPANNFNMTIFARAEIVRDGYEYDYAVSNMASSAQSINNLMIATCGDSLKEYSPKGWKGLGVKILSLARFVDDIDMENFVRPGMTLKGFKITDGCLPGISKYYAQAPHKVPSYEPQGIMAHLSDFDNDFLSNSVNGYTIGPVKLPGSFVPGVFLDTLISYTHRSVALGWLRDDKSHDQDCDDFMKQRDWYNKGDFEKYGRWKPDNDWEFDHDWNRGVVGILDGRLEKAKEELGRHDSVKARRDLEIFVMEIEMLNHLSGVFLLEKHAPVRTPIISSEAYALLRFNAEYLIDKLPERSRR